ncbi:MAG: ribosome silencing factor [Planctomycetes bacterium]|nr:ribosome silencing factor [Planctomycetota bacterium]
MAEFDLEKTVQEWNTWLDENKAEDVQFVDLRGHSDITDAIIVLTVNNTRHMAHLSEDAMRFAKARGEGLIAADGLDSREWVVLDFGIYMVHIFLPETRAQYSIEDFWDKYKSREKSDESIEI